MKVRYKKNHDLVDCASNFNMTALSEVILSDTSEYTSKLEVFLEKTQEWKDMNQAFKDHDIIIDNYNTHFFEPPTEEDRKRGYTL